jgi:PAS domain S-box-containing protein
MNDDADFPSAPRTGPDAPSGDANEAEFRKFALIAARTDNAIVLTDPAARIEWTNEGFTRLTGYTLAEVRGRKPGDFLQGPDTDPATVAYMHERLARQRGFQTEIVNYGKDGAPYWIAIEVQPIRDDTGRLVNYMAIQSDITRRKQLELSLREGEERFALALNATGEGVWDWDIARDTVRHNQRWLDLLGLGPEFLVHPIDRFTTLIPAEDQPVVMKQIQRCMDGEGPFFCRHRMIRSDGGVIWVEDRGNVTHRAADGAPLRMVGSVTDITARQHAEESLRVQFGLARTLAASASFSDDSQAGILRVICEEMHWDLGLLWLVQADGAALACHSHFAVRPGVGARVLDISRNLELARGLGLPGRVWAAATPEWMPDLAQDPGCPRAVEALADRLHCTVAVPISAAGQVLGVIEFFGPEITPPNADRLSTLVALGTQLGQFVERVRAGEELRRRGDELVAANARLAHVSRLKDAFLASMSHELRTPLNSILGLSESLIDQVHGPLNERQSRYLSLVHSSGRHLLALINDILDLAKIEAGKEKLHIETVSLADVCGQAVQLVQPMATKRRQSVESDIPLSGLRVRVDARRFIQMLVNLLGNAVKFTPENGRLGLRVELAGRELRVAVWDHGIGIPAADLARLFERFVQLDNRLSRGYEGTGLGLALVKQLITLHGGRIEVASTPDHGSTFTLILPDSVVLQGKSAPAPLILIAEDKPSNVVAIQDHLEHHGCRVLLAENGGQAVDLVVSGRPQLVLMDIQMPVVDGIEAIRRIRALPDPALAAVPIIAITALTMTGDRELCLEAGANEYMDKPVSPKALYALVVKLLPAPPSSP